MTEAANRPAEGRPHVRRGQFWASLGKQLQEPSGQLGSAMGWAMRIVNAVPNRLAIDALDLRPGQAVLEIGCGPGAAMAAMARRVPGLELHGLDHSSVMIAQAAARNRRLIARGRVQLATGTWDRLPWPEGRFDRVLMVNVTYFLPDGGTALREVHRVLRPGGAMVAYATDRQSMRNWPFAERATHRLFDPADFEVDLKAAGFAADLITSSAVRLPLGVEGFVVTARRHAEGAHAPNPANTETTNHVNQSTIDTTT